MKLKQRRAFDEMLLMAMPAVLSYMNEVGAPDPEDATQGIMLDMCVAAKDDSSLCEPFEFWPKLNEFRDDFVLSIPAHYRCPPFKALWHARNVEEPHTPDNVVMAAEMASLAEREGILPVVMGDTLSEEAEYFGMSRQRIHQMVNQARDSMSEYLVKS